MGDDKILCRSNILCFWVAALPRCVLCSEKFFLAALAKGAYSVIPAKAGIQNSLNPALSGTGFRVALRLPGMTTPPCFREYCQNLSFHGLWCPEGT